MKNPLRWFSFFDARFINDELAGRLAASGCIFLKIGMESADDRILEGMAKPCRVRHYRQAAASLTKAGISLDAYFILGFPGETEESVCNTVENINSFAVPDRSVHQLLFFPFQLAPLARIFGKRERARYGLTGYMSEWSHATMDSATARSLIPQAVRRISAMNPMFGNVEKMLVNNGTLLAEIDGVRGSLIREKLATSTENPRLWARLRDCARRLRMETDPATGSLSFL